MLQLKGKKFGRLYVIGKTGKKSSNGSVIWECLCDCGNTCEVISSSLNNNLTRSCGCLYDETKYTKTSTHGKTKTPEYNSWLAMRQRCLYPHHQHYHLYGGRGITVCERWKTSFEAFLEDMGEKPSSKHTLDRIDNEGNYEPRNCKWSTPHEQSFNVRINSNNKTGFPGVHFHGVTGKWAASISIDGVNHHLGVFESIDDAYNARLNEERKYYGTEKYSRYINANSSEDDRR